MNHITMVDYGIGNLRSVQKALEFAGARVEVTGAPARIAVARKLVLPGVGAFGAGIAALRQRNLVTPIKEAVAAGTPLLGICLGMQLLFDESDEMGVHQGLGLLSGRVLRFGDDGLLVPHTGWNQIQHDGSHPLLRGVPDGAHAYFVHSYYCEPKSPQSTIARTSYGRSFTAIAARDNVVGLQFHPEKSQQIGVRILENFINSL